MLDSRELMMGFLPKTTSMTALAFCRLILIQLMILENRSSDLSMRKTIDLQPLNVRTDPESFRQQKLNPEKKHIHNKSTAILKRINKVLLLKCNNPTKGLMSFMRKIPTKNNLLDTHSQIIIKLHLLIFSKLNLSC